MVFPDTTIKGLVPLGPMGTISGGAKVSGRRHSDVIAPTSLRLSRFALRKTTTRPLKRLGEACRNGKLMGDQGTDSLISKRDFEAVDYASAYGNSDDGHHAFTSDVYQKASGLNLRQLLPYVEVVVSRKNRKLFTSTQSNKNTSSYYNQLSSQLVGNCENRVSAQPVANWFLTTFTTGSDVRVYLFGKGLATEVWGYIPLTWEKVYSCTFSDLKCLRGRF